MISITSSSFSYKTNTSNQRDSIQITIHPVVGTTLLLQLFLFEAFSWGVSIFLNEGYSFGIIGTIMLIIFLTFSFYTGKSTISINPETRFAHTVGWSSQKLVKWTSDMKLTYARRFNDSNELNGISVYLVDSKGNETSLLVIESEESFLEFVNVYNQKFPAHAIASR